MALLDARATILNGETTQPTASPPVTGSSSLVVNAADGALVFDEMSAYGVMLLAPQIPHPWIKDYCGTVPEVDLSSRATLKPADERGLNIGDTRVTTTIGTYAPLLITGAIRARWLLDVFTTLTGADLDICDYGGVGESIATNFVWNFNVGAGSLDALRESTAGGTDHLPKWRMPGGWQQGQQYLCDIRADGSGNATAFVNGLQLRRFKSAAGVTDLGNGECSGWSTDGDGSSVSLCQNGLATDNEFDLFFFHLYNEADPADGDALAYATGKRLWTVAELEYLIGDNAALAAEAGTVVCLDPSATGLVDLKGTIASWSASGTVTKLIAEAYWTAGTDDWIAATQAALQITGDLTIRARVQCEGAFAGRIVEHGGAGEGSGENWLYFLQNDTATTLRFFWETGAGVDVDTKWTIDTMINGEIREWIVTREDIGGGIGVIKAYERQFPTLAWTQLTTIASTTGTDNMDGSADVTLPTGGAGTVTFRVRDLASSHSASVIQIKNVVSAPI